MKYQKSFYKITVVLLGLLPILLCIAVIAAIVLPVIFSSPADSKPIPVIQVRAEEKASDRTVSR